MHLLFVFSISLLRRQGEQHAHRKRHTSAQDAFQLFKKMRNLYQTDSNGILFLVATTNQIVRKCIGTAAFLFFSVMNCIQLLNVAIQSSAI